MNPTRMRAAFLTTMLFLLVFQPSASGAVGQGQAVIYFNDACLHCLMYIDDELEPVLEELGFEVIRKDYINYREYRKELNDLNDEFGIPLQLQGHFTTFVGESIILEGHVPEHVIRDILKEENQVSEKIIVFQDEMDGATFYRVWAYEGEIMEYPIDTPIEEYLSWFTENRDSLVTPPELLAGDIDFSVFLPMVLVTGLLDGINPCAFAVMLFLITFLFTIRKSRASVFKTGVAYISAIYIVYFLIGLGILQAIHIFGVHHFMAMAGAYLIIGLGIINLANYFFPQFPVKLAIPGFSKKTLEAWAHKATIPSALVLGGLVGLCVFPCSGAIYVAIIGLLSANVAYFTTISYLLIYNLMFVLPLIAILLATSNKYVTKKLTQWERSQSGHMHLLSGIVMVALGVIILVWFV